MPKHSISKHLEEFSKRARSVLWRQNPGKEKRKYNEWEMRIKELESGGGFFRGEAVICASKDFPCLYPLFREYDVREYDKNTDSHPGIQHFGDVAQSVIDQDKVAEVVILDQEKSYRENLNWAMDAAGEFSRLKRHPGLCPNNQAWFLYDMARENPKDFLMRVGQSEAKSTDGDKNASQRASKRSIAELSRMLDELDYEEEEPQHEESEPSEDSDIEVPAEKKAGEVSD